MGAVALSKSKNPSNILFFNIGDNQILDAHLKVVNRQDPALLVIRKEALRSYKVSEDKIFDFITNQDYSKLNTEYKDMEKLAPFTDNPLDIDVYTDFPSILNELQTELQKHQPDIQLIVLNSSISAITQDGKVYTFKNFDGSN